MKFSVLMSVYYKENPQYLQESLDSLINQTLKPNEIVIVKDGELTAELDDLIAKYVEEHSKLFKIIEFEKNRGLGIALREGVLVCSNELIARLDSDDIALTDRFERQVRYMEQNPDVDMVGGFSLEFQNNIGNIIAIRTAPESDQDIKNYARKRNPFNHTTVMYRKTAVLKSGNYEDFLWNEDYYLWVRMIINACKFYNLQTGLSYFRANYEMFERRGGLKYAMLDIKLQREFLKLSFINYREYISNVVSRVMIRLMPNQIRRYIYVNFLRGKGESI